MAAKYQTQFDINRGELEIIEKALRDQARSLYEKTAGQDKRDRRAEMQCEEQIKTRMSAIQSVLGKLHNQKIWFVPKEHVPLG